MTLLGKVAVSLPLVAAFTSDPGESQRVRREAEEVGSYRGGKLKLATLVKSATITAAREVRGDLLGFAIAVAGGAASRHVGRTD